LCSVIYYNYIVLMYFKTCCFHACCRQFIDKDPTKLPKGVSLSVGTFPICQVENLLCEAGHPTLPEMRERDMAMTAIRILSNTEHPTRHLYTSLMYDHYVTKPNTPKPICIRAMEYLGRFGIDARKIEPTQHS
jgi:hypothetical protein